MHKCVFCLNALRNMYQFKGEAHMFICVCWLLDNCFFPLYFCQEGLILLLCIYFSFSISLPCKTVRPFCCTLFVCVNVRVYIRVRVYACFSASLSLCKYKCKCELKSYTYISIYKCIYCMYIYV